MGAAQNGAEMTAFDRSRPIGRNIDAGDMDSVLFGTVKEQFDGAVLDDGGQVRDRRDALGGEGVVDQDCHPSAYAVTHRSGTAVLRDKVIMFKLEFGEIDFAQVGFCDNAHPRPEIIHDLAKQGKLALLAKTVDVNTDDSNIDGL